MTHIQARGVFVGGEVRIIADHAYRRDLQRAERRWAEGEALTLWISTEEDGLRYSQLKHYYGHLVTPLAQDCGYTKTEQDLMLKAMFLPEGKTSLTQLTYDEMDDYSKTVESFIREERPEALGRCNYWREIEGGRNG